VAGRFKVLTDEHWSRAHIQAAREAGWDVTRVVDVLGQETDDPQVLAYCAGHGLVWITSDEHAKGHVTEWLQAGKALPGVVIVPQRHRVTLGRLVQILERLASEEAPFAGVIRFAKQEER
jgi:hypothetical protein